jgi:2-dehydro-3-deoxygalactonokinase
MQKPDRFRTTPDEKRNCRNLTGKCSSPISAVEVRVARFRASGEGGGRAKVSSEADWIAVDWGTSNLRAWGIGNGGQVVFTRASDQGMGKLTPEAFPDVLNALLDGAVPPTGPALDVLISGMAGARQGWLEAPYLDAPADLGGLVFGAVRPDMASTRFSPRILPGVCQKFAGAEDVIRGEETQLLGLTVLRPGFAGIVCMPGTHSKWVQLDGGRLVRFGTAMTGELYEALRAHTVLRHSLEGDQTGPAAEEGVAEGLEAGLERPQQLTSLLFRTRAASLLSGRGPDWCSGYLSGLLIGAEIGGRRDWISGGAAAIPLIGSERLCRLYGAALAKIGVQSEFIDATDATIAGLIEARRQGLS